MNWRHSQSCTCMVTALSCPVGVDTCANMRANLAKRFCAKFSTFPSIDQKLRAARRCDSLAFRVAFRKASRKSLGQPPWKRRCSAFKAPTPTSQLCDKSCAFGYAMSMLTMSILAQVSPKPRPDWMVREISSNFSKLGMLLLCKIGQTLSATSSNVRVRIATLRAKFSSLSSWHNLSGIARNADVWRGCLVFLRYASMLRVTSPSSLKYEIGSLQKPFFCMTGSCASRNT
mmetsp:Transcript_32060/g.72093  ORF Transcript_32060/g.72093 Transcript_32060/m.72093 type:complete len:230 (-) Transcript_32060:384-1073(-)